MSIVRYLLGVDAGNTKTIALVARLDGTVVGAGRAGCGDIYGASSAEAALTEVDRAVCDATAAAGASLAAVGAGAFSLAGADWPEDFDFLHAAMRRQGYAQRIAVYNDALGALWAGAPHGPAVVVACGTGAAIAARNAAGATWHTSHWQEPHGSHQLSFKVLRATCRAELGIDPPTRLSVRMLDLFSMDQVEQVLHLFTARGAAWPAPARRLAGILLDEAHHGDATARRIVLEHGAALGDYALAAARKVGLEKQLFTLVLTGGLLRHPSPLLSDAIVSQVRSASPEAHPVVGCFEPALGAVLLACELGQIVVDEALLARLAASSPPASFFAT